MILFEYSSPSWCNLSWTPWIPFASNGEGFKILPRQHGIYRVKPINEDYLMYIGQTGRTLRQRLSELGVYQNSKEMPYNDPHTAAPSLWAWRDATGMDFVCSASAIPSSGRDDPRLERRKREGIECYLLWQYRLENGKSTLCNFGRFHPHYVKSSSRKTGKRGGRLPEGEINPAGGPSYPPLQPKGKPQDNDWMNLDWSDMFSLNIHLHSNVPDSAGLYKIIDYDEESLIYIGQSMSLKKRLQQHARKKWDDRIVSFSYYMPNQYLLPHQLKEIENDLIGDYFSRFKTVPKYQFLNY